MKIYQQVFSICFCLLALAFSLFSCQSSLTDEEIETADLMAIKAYVASNQLQGEFISNDIFVSIEDSGSLSLQVDTLAFLDTVFVDTFYVDTVMTDSTSRMDTILVDTQLVESQRLDSSFSYEYPTATDTVLFSFDLYTLDGRLVIGTGGEVFRLEDGNYPTPLNLLPGLRRGLLFFARESKGSLLIPSEQAYGRAGNGEIVPPNTPIKVDVHMFDFY